MGAIYMMFTSLSKQVGNRYVLCLINHYSLIVSLEIVTNVAFGYKGYQGYLV